MIEQGETQIVVRVVVAVAAEDLFAVLADPHRHPDIDGSGMVRADVEARPITEVGQVFTMQMHYPELGDYRTDNHVIAVVPDRRLVWTTAREGQPSAGVRWSWEFEPQPDGRTVIVHTYDWSQVSDPAVLARVRFPRVSPDALRRSVSRLVRAATPS